MVSCKETYSLDIFVENSIIRRVQLCDGRRATFLRSNINPLLSKTAQNSTTSRAEMSIVANINQVLRKVLDQSLTLRNDATDI